MEYNRDNMGRTSLIWVAINEDFDLMSKLIDRHLDLQDNDGMTTLMFCSRYEKCVKLLIDSGANIDLTEVCGWSAIMWSTFYKSHECVKLLIDAGSSLDFQDVDGNTALHIASNGECLKLLVEAGANINIRNKYGKTSKTFSEIYHILKQFSLKHPISDDILFECNTFESYNVEYGKEERCYMELTGDYKYCDLLVNVNFKSWKSQISIYWSTYTPLLIKIFSNSYPEFGDAYLILDDDKMRKCLSCISYLTQYGENEYMLFGMSREYLLYSIHRENIT